MLKTDAVQKIVYDQPQLAKTFPEHPFPCQDVGHIHRYAEGTWGKHQSKNNIIVILNIFCNAYLLLQHFVHLSVSDDSISRVAVVTQLLQFQEQTCSCVNQTTQSKESIVYCGRIEMHKAQLIQKSLSNQAALCWSMWWIHMTKLNPKSG